MYTLLTRRAHAPAAAAVTGWSMLPSLGDRAAANRPTPTFPTLEHLDGQPKSLRASQQ
jgi:hypothetical protein